MRMPTSGTYKIKGVRDVIAGCVEQGVVMPDGEAVYTRLETSLATSGALVIVFGCYTACLPCRSSTSFSRSPR